MTRPSRSSSQIPARPGRDDTGSTAVEIVILAPVLLALLGLALVAGRYETAAGTVEAASAAAARAASLARSPDTARRDATRVASATLTHNDLDCRDLTVSIDTAGFGVPPAHTLRTGVPAHVTATITCHLSVADLAVPGLPGTLTISSTTTSALDTHRAHAAPS
jgi:Flp pilus assembly protein TadG